MFAIIESGGKQYKVEKGTTLELEKLDSKEGTTITIDKILLIHDKNSLKIGTPYVENLSVTAKVLGHKKGPKELIFRMNPKHRYQRSKGHRQNLTMIEITDIKEHATGSKAATEKTTEVKEVAAKVPKKITVKKTTTHRTSPQKTKTPEA